MKSIRLLAWIVVGTVLGNLVTGIIYDGLQQQFLAVLFGIAVIGIPMAVGALLGFHLERRRRDRLERKERLVRLSDRSEDFEGSDWPSEEDVEEDLTPRKRRMHS